MKIGKDQLHARFINVEDETLPINTYSIDELSDKSGYERLDELYATATTNGTSIPRPIRIGLR